MSQVENISFYGLNIGKPESKIIFYGYVWTIANMVRSGFIIFTAITIL